VLKEGEDYQFREYDEPCFYQFVDLDGVEHTGPLATTGDAESVASKCCETCNTTDVKAGGADVPPR
jgi:hypothetical protein